MIKFIENNRELGRVYDYKKVNKVFKGLGIPKPYDRPLTSYGYDKSWTHVLLSKRNEGKTTNTILYGLCMRKCYDGFTIAYIRQNEKMTTLQNTRSLFSVILECDYVTKLFGEKYNTVVYKSRAWYLANQDDKGEILDTDLTPFMVMLSCDKSDAYKSATNLPTCDLIIYDEFIPMRGYTPADEFIWFNDIIKTLLRKRISAHIFLLANNVDLEHKYFDELGIYESVQSLKEGEHSIYYTDVFQTPVYVEWVCNDTSQRKEENKRQIFQYFGYRNKKLGSIRGGGWSIKEFPRIKILKNDYKVIKNRYLQVNDTRFLKIDIYKRDKLLFALVHDTTPPTKEDAIVYTKDFNIDYRFRRGFGFTKLDNYIWQLLGKGKVFFSSNGVGSAFENYVKDVKRIATIS